MFELSSDSRKKCQYCQHMYHTRWWCMKVAIDNFFISFYFTNKIAIVTLHIKFHFYFYYLSFSASKNHIYYKQKIHLDDHWCVFTQLLKQNFLRFPFIEYQFKCYGLSEIIIPK